MIISQIGDDLFLKELVASAPSRKNWRGMFIAIMVILAVCGLIVTAVILMSPTDDGPRVKGMFSFNCSDIYIYNKMLELVL